MRVFFQMIFALLVLALATFCIASASGESKGDTAAERKAQIDGIPVVVAGILNSRGIACAQPLGD